MKVQLGEQPALEIHGCALTTSASANSQSDCGRLMNWN